MRILRRHSTFTCRLELLMIRLRDAVRSPGGVLMASGVKPGMAVLDFGCGPGGFSLAAAQLVGPAGRVYALDVQPLALESVRNGAMRRGLSNVETVQASDIAKLQDSSMDMVLLYDVLHIHPEPERTRETLEIIHRVLRPAGVLSVRDHHIREPALTALMTRDGLFRPAGMNRWASRFERVEKCKRTE